MIVITIFPSSTCKIAFMLEILDRDFPVYYQSGYTSQVGIQGLMLDICTIMTCVILMRDRVIGVR